jgi:hypothetical protein
MFLELRTNLFRSNYSNSANVGTFTLNLNNLTSNSNANTGSRLTCSHRRVSTVILFKSYFITSPLGET